MIALAIRPGDELLRIGRISKVGMMPDRGSQEAGRVNEKKQRKKPAGSLSHFKNRTFL